MCKIKRHFDNAYEVLKRFGGQVGQLIKKVFVPRTKIHAIIEGSIAFIASIITIAMVFFPSGGDTYIETQMNIERYIHAEQYIETQITTDGAYREFTLRKLEDANHYADMAQRAWEDHQYSIAERCFLDALDEISNVHGQGHDDVAAIRNNLGCLYIDMAKYPEAYEQLLSAKVAYEAKYGHEHSYVAGTCNNLASLYKAQGDREGALKYHLLALNIREKVLDKEHTDAAHIDIAETYNNLAGIFRDQNDYENAFRYCLLALGIYEGVLGKEHPYTAGSYNNLAGLYQERGDYENAMKYHLLALDINETTLGKGHPSTANTYNNLGGLYLALGEYENARKYLLMAASINEKLLGKEHHATAMNYGNLALIYEAQGDDENMIKYFLLTSKALEKALGDHPDTAESYNDLALRYSLIDDYANAQQYFRLALGIYEKVLGREDVATARTNAYLAATLLRMGEKEAAKQYAQDSYTVFYLLYGEEDAYTITARRLLDEATISP